MLSLETLSWLETVLRQFLWLGFVSWCLGFDHHSKTERKISKKNLSVSHLLCFSNSVNHRSAENTLESAIKHISCTFIVAELSFGRTSTWATVRPNVRMLQITLSPVAWLSLRQRHLYGRELMSHDSASPLQLHLINNIPLSISKHCLRIFAGRRG